MKIWVDADACPGPVKQIIMKAALRLKIEATFVSNQALNVPISPLIKRVRVSQGFDVADHYIIEHAAAGDFIVTADIPLADAVVSKGCIAINPRGEVYTTENIKQFLSMRDFHDTLRSSGLISGGPAKLNARDIREFANGLDRELHKKR